MYPLLWPYLAWRTIRTEDQKNKAFEYAKALSNGKGIVNVGARGTWFSTSPHIANDQKVVLNVDIQNSLPKFFRWDLEEPLPFGNREFDVAFASHVLEHLDNWEQAFAELRRVADHVVIVLPHPLDVLGYIHPGHKQHFTGAEMAWMGSFPGVHVFY